MCQISQKIITFIGFRNVELLQSYVFFRIDLKNEVSSYFSTGKLDLSHSGGIRLGQHSGSYGRDGTTGVDFRRRLLYDCGH
jgi:hypothetical protein